MLMDPDQRRIDEDIFEVRILRRCLKSRSHTPFCAHRQKRVYTVYHLPNSSGRSRHGAPVRATHNTPSTNKRLSSPLRPGSPILPGNSGAIRSHCALLKTVRIKADLHFSALESEFYELENRGAAVTNVNRP